MSKPSRKVTLFCLLLILCGYAHAAELMSASDLLEIARSSYDKGKKMNTIEELGMLAGNMVVAEYMCGGLCPVYTRRVIHYRIPLDQCEQYGGSVLPVRVTRGRGSSRESFCFPKIISTHWDTVVW